MNKGYKGSNTRYHTQGLIRTKQTWKAFVAVLFSGILALGLLAGCTSVSRNLETSWSSSKPEARYVEVDHAYHGINFDTASSGYITVCYQSERQLKLVIEKDDSEIRYTFAGNGTAHVIPLGEGEGLYTFSVYEHKEDTTYTLIEAESYSVVLADEQAPFLIPSVACSYSPESECVTFADEIAATSVDDKEFVDNVMTWLRQNITYDDDRGNSPPVNYYSDADLTLSENKGICIDVSTLAAAMLRSQGIPTKIVTGYVNNAEGNEKFHSWNEVYLDDTWQLHTPQPYETFTVKSVLRTQ